MVLLYIIQVLQLGYSLQKKQQKNNKKKKNGYINNQLPKR